MHKVCSEVLENMALLSLFTILLLSRTKDLPYVDETPYLYIANVTCSAVAAISESSFGLSDKGATGPWSLQLYKLTCETY